MSVGGDPICSPLNLNRKIPATVSRRSTGNRESQGFVFRSDPDPTRCEGGDHEQAWGSRPPSDLPCCIQRSTDSDPRQLRFVCAHGGEAYTEVRPGSGMGYTVFATGLSGPRGRHIIFSGNLFTVEQ